jgi:hypothetical protein
MVTTIDEVDGVAWAEFGIIGIEIGGHEKDAFSIGRGHCVTVSCPRLTLMHFAVMSFLQSRYLAC